MSRIIDIIQRARYTLADPDAERWTDDRLLSLVSEAVEDIVIHTQMLKTSIDIAMIAGQANYDLPSDCFLILRASVDSREIPLTSHTVLDEQARRAVFNENRSSYWERAEEFVSGNDFDNRSLTWEDDTGPEVEALVYDNRSPNTIKVYPIPNDDIVVDQYTFENAGTVLFAGDELYGTVVEIETNGVADYTFDSPFGSVTDFYDPLIAFESFEQDLGILSSVGETTTRVSIQYVKSAASLISLEDTLPIPTMYDKALKYYVIAHAFDDDYDTGNEAKSNKALALYNRELELAKNHQRKDGVKTVQHRTQYRSAFE